MSKNRATLPPCRLSTALQKIIFLKFPSSPLPAALRPLGRAKTVKHDVFDKGFSQSSSVRGRSHSKKGAAKATNLKATLLHPCGPSSTAASEFRTIRLGAQFYLTRLRACTDISVLKHLCFVIQLLAIAKLLQPCKLIRF